MFDLCACPAALSETLDYETVLSHCVAKIGSFDVLKPSEPHFDLGNGQAVFCACLFQTSKPSRGNQSFLSAVCRLADQ